MIRQSSVRVLPVLICALVSLLPRPAAASPIFSVTNGSLAVTALFSGSSIEFDIRGAVLLSVSDPAAGLAPSALAVFDVTGGTDPSGSVLPFGNTFLIATDEDSAVTNLAVLLLFDFAQAVTDSAYGLRVPAMATMVNPGSTPDAILATLVNNSPVPVHFNFTNLVDLGGGYSIMQWELDALGDVPEPGSYLLFSTGILTIAGLRIRRWRSRRA